MKKILSVLLVLLLFTACGKSIERDMPTLSPAQQELHEQYLKKKKKWSSKDFSKEFEANSKEEIRILNKSGLYVPRPIDGDINFEITRLEADQEREIAARAEDVCRFINEKYEADWHFDAPKVYTAPAVPGALAESFNDVIVLYGRPNVDSNSFRTTLVHEIVHYLFYINTGTSFCYLYNSEGLVAGRYLHEAVTEYLTYRYINEVWDMSILKINDGETKSPAYNLLVYNVEEINITWEIDLAKEVIHDNLNAISEMINKSLDDPDAFVVILNSIDTIKDGSKSSYSYVTQAELNQLYFFVADKEKDKELIAATEECLLSEFLIYPSLRKPRNAIGVWNEVAKMKGSF